MINVNMIVRSWCRLVKRKQRYSRISSEKASPVNEVSCDDCGKFFQEVDIETKKREKFYEKQLCGSCGKKENGRKISKIGSNVLKSFSVEEKKIYASKAGKISHLKSPNNSGKFSTDRWNNLTSEQQNIQVTRASNALQVKLNSDEKFKREHYLKIFKNSRIGFTSKGHNELHAFLKDLGFIQHVQISSMEVDECNEELRIVVEFNGDMYHCNPRSWKPDDYNKVIKMTAKEKWENDRKRFYRLKNFGYITFVVWEEDWASNRELIKNSLFKFIKNRENEINKKGKN